MPVPVSWLVIALLLTISAILPSTHAIGYCNVTASMNQNVSHGEEFSAGFVRLAFPQTSGFTLDTISSHIPREIAAGLALNGERSVCIWEKFNEVVPYLNLLLIPFSITDFTPTPAAFAIQDTPSASGLQNTSYLSEFNVQSGDMDMGVLQATTPEPVYLSRLWTAVNTATSWVATTTYLKTVDVTRSSRSTGQIIRMRYCEPYQSLQELNTPCPDVPAPSKNEAGSWLGGVLFVVAIVVTAVSAVVVWWLYIRYERQADYKTAEQIKKTAKLHQSVLSGNLRTSGTSFRTTSGSSTNSYIAPETTKLNLPNQNSGPNAEPIPSVDPAGDPSSSNIFTIKSADDVPPPPDYQ